VEDLVQLPGVGRKTANVVAGYCYGTPAIIVDTHFKRVIGRLKLSDETNPDKIERSMWDLIPELNRTRFSMVVNEHGRRVCAARKPRCPECVIADLCPFPA
jgi:endonuclease-3